MLPGEQAVSRHFGDFNQSTTHQGRSRGILRSRSIGVMILQSRIITDFVNDTRELFTAQG